MRRFILSCCLLLIFCAAQSQTKWTLRQCMDAAIKNNPTIGQKALDVENSKIDLSTAKNSRLPNLNADIGQNFNFGRTIVETTNAAIASNSSATSFSISSTAPLFTGFRIPNQIKMSEFNLQAATEGLNKAKENLELQVTAYYLEVLFKKELLRVYKEQAELSKSQIEQTQILVESGKVPQSQLFDVKALYAKDELNVTVANNDLILSLVNLSQAMNLQSNDQFDIVVPVLGDVIAENQSSILPVEDIYQIAIATRPHMKEAKYNLESSKRALKIAQADFYPQMNFNLGYSNALNRIYNFDNPDIGKQFTNNGREYIGFSLSIPIFNRFQVRNQVRSARVNIEYRELELDNVRLALYNEIQQAYQNAVAARAKFSSSEVALDAAVEAFKYAQQRFEVGKSTIFEFNEIRTKLISSESEQIQAKFDFLFRAKILDFYRDKEIVIE